jgi:hypothetical protein
MRVYVGMDVHRKRSQVALLDEHGGQLLNRNLPNGSAELVAVLGRLEPGTPVAFEAAYGWGWLAALPTGASRSRNRCGARPVGSCWLSFRCRRCSGPS